MAHVSEVKTLKWWPLITLLRIDFVAIRAALDEKLDGECVGPQNLFSCECLQHALDIFLTFYIMNKELKALTSRKLWPSNQEAIVTFFSKLLEINQLFIATFGWKKSWKLKKLLRLSNLISLSFCASRLKNWWIL